MAPLPFDPYVFDTLLRDLVGHGRKASQFLVFVFLYRHTHAAGRATAAFSHSVMAESVGLSKRSVQAAIYALVRRKLVRSHRRKPTSVPQYTVLTPWRDRVGAPARLPAH